MGVGDLCDRLTTHAVLSPAVHIIRQDRGMMSLYVNETHTRNDVRIHPPPRTGKTEREEPVRGSDDKDQLIVDYYYEAIIVAGIIKTKKH